MPSRGPYWHRDLQVVPYCTEHSCLAQFCADAGDCWHHGYRTADRATPANVLKNFARSGQGLEQLALDVQYLLHENGFLPEPFQTRMALAGRCEMVGDRLSRSIGQMRVTERGLITKIWGSDMLAGAVQSACAAGGDSLAAPVVLVACRLLGISVRELLLSAGLMAGERDVWPCMNKDALCFSWPTIHRVEFKSGSAKMVCRVCRGDYACKLPLKAKEALDLVSCERKAERGPWRTRMLKMWFGWSAEVSAIALVLGRAPEKILSEARAAGLPWIPGVPDSCLMTGDFLLRRKHYREVLRQKLTSGEIKGWMEFRKMHPQVARWLWLWDVEFAKAVRKECPITERLRDGKLDPVRCDGDDDQIEQALGPLVLLIKNRRPVVRVTALALLRAASKERRWLSHEVKSSFPKSTRRAAELEETQVDFLKRKVSHTFLELSAENHAAPDFDLVVGRARLGFYWHQVRVKREAVQRAYLESCAGTRPFRVNWLCVGNSTRRSEIVVQADGEIFNGLK